MIQWLYNLINIGVSLVGYYFAAFFMDHKHYGRKRMQVGCVVFADDDADMQMVCATRVS